MPDVSPTKWHLAHTTWFFETFVLKKWMPRYRPEVPEYAYLFNSYYNAAGEMHRRDLRGLISRPTVEETHRYRSSIDSYVDNLLSAADEKLLAEIEPVVTLGIHHEQQHQELLLTDIKHVLAQNPLYPVFRERKSDLETGKVLPQHFVEFEETTAQIGHDGNAFSYDNEGPRHRALVPHFSLANRVVTNGEYLKFIEAGGYTRPEFWLSLGWITVNEQRWQAPLYWVKRDGAWWNFTLSGFRPVEESEPVTHVSYFEADAFANWSGARLPTEFEWERAATDFRSRETSSKANTFIPKGRVLWPKIDILIKCSATFGSGRAARIHLTPDIARGRARLANTMASSCATSTCCAAALAPRRARTFAERIAISFRPRNAGSSPGFGSRATLHEPRARPTRRARS